MKLARLATCFAVLTLVLLLCAGPASAAKRDVIADANAICSAAPTDPSLLAACLLQFNTNGEQILGDGCQASLANGDNGVVNYLLRNCDRNEEALLRKASSAVLSINDLVSKGKTDQAATAALYLCTYAGSYMTLQGAGKLVSLQDLAADAQDIAGALGFPCQ